VGRDAGISAEKLTALAEYEHHPLFSELERLVLAYADHLARTPVRVPETLFARLRAQLDEAQLVELTSAIAWENYRGRFNRAFAIESDGFSEGAFCVVPVRAPAALPSGDGRPA